MLHGASPGKRLVPEEIGNQLQPPTLDDRPMSRNADQPSLGGLLQAFLLRLLLDAYE